MFVERTLSSIIPQVASTFPALLVTGPRQVGKTTLLEKCAGPSMNQVSLDDLQQRHLAQEDPALFIQRFPPPILIDEVQLAPNLFTYIKIEVDRLRKSGLFWLTGSQQFHLMKNISESLAGRVGILKLLGLSLAERTRRAKATSPFLPIFSDLKQREEHALPLSLQELYEFIWRGSFPALVLNSQMNRDIFFDSYLQTYLQRDVRELTRVGDESTFLKFIRATAARTAQLLNIAELARDVGIDAKTAKMWLSVLEASGLIYLLEPYHTNITKRLIKSPKLYFLETGLCSYLTQWTSPKTLEAGAMSGAILETFIFSEILKTYWHNAKRENFYFYRDKDQREIDLLIEENGMLYPIEFKKSASPHKDMVKHFSALEKLSLPIGQGGLICLHEKFLPITQQINAIPVGLI